ncbi:MAG: hypothetical protein ABI277_02845 [Burkholderiaceae bacterium]
MTPRVWAILVAITTAVAGCGGRDDGSPGSTPAAAARPNILFVIMAGVGIDRMKSFGYAAARHRS